MKIKLFTAAAVCGLLAACDSGDINITPTTVDNSQDNSQVTTAPDTSDPVNPCASYIIGGNTIQGSFSSPDCVYTTSFVDSNNPLTVNMTIPALSDGGVHRFSGSLMVGEGYTSDADLAAAGISQGGDGPTLTVDAGAVVTFESNQQFVGIQRGSQLIARGTLTSPITFTSGADIDDQRAATQSATQPEAVQQWGGMLIAGFGVTNNCSYTGTRGSTADPLTPASECHEIAEGLTGADEIRWGGNNDDDSSGTLEYVVVKHTGVQIGAGNELNGITFAGVGRGTTVNNIQVYSTYDDGIEMFGGDFDITNFVAMYANDDSIDVDSGWQGSIQNALVIQSETNGNRCIEADGLAGFSGLPAMGVGSADDLIARNLNSRPTISNLTCIFSPRESADNGGTSTHDPGAGFRLREGLWPTINDSLIIGSFQIEQAPGDNWCIRADDVVQDALVAGDATISATVFSCETQANDTENTVIATGNQFQTVPAGTTLSAFAATDTDFQALEGMPGIYSIDTATMMVNGAATTVVPSITAGGTARVGGLSLADTDWTAGWTYGIDPDNRGQDLWFEN